MKTQRYFGTIVMLVITVTSSFAQHERYKPTQPIICYASSDDNHFRVPPPGDFLNRKNSAGRVKSSSIIVTYSANFPGRPRLAVEYAKMIWESILQSPVPIYVEANWIASGNFLASASSAFHHKNFVNAPLVDVFYPQALAEKIAGHALNPDGDPDIIINFRETVGWYFGLDGETPSGQLDMVSAALHEFAHGLGLASSCKVYYEWLLGFWFINKTATVGLSGGSPLVFDLGLENALMENIYLAYAGKSSELADQLTSNAVYFTSPSILENNAHEPASIYAPMFFQRGSSISHLDESSYTNTDNALMTPTLRPGESIHDPGPVTRSMLSDMGWDFTRICHEPLLPTTNVDDPFMVTATITSDFSPVRNVMLHYQTGEQMMDIPMTEANGQYQAVLPSTGVPGTYVYYISAEDNRNRVYTNPGKRIDDDGESQTYFSFFTTPETLEINHTPASFVLDTDEILAINASIVNNVNDFTSIPIEGVELEYRIGYATYIVPLHLKNGSTVYTVDIDLRGRVERGDVIEYRIRAIDQIQQVKYSPSDMGYHSVKVLGIAPTVDSYANDFNTASDDFAGDMSIITPEGFATGALHTSHPYPVSLANAETNIAGQLLIPIRVKEQYATIKFDEIVLVDPSSDYVVVEGSKDRGETWTSFIHGYDSRDDDDWLSRYYYAIDDEASVAKGDPSLYRTRVIDMLTSFQPGDEVLIRFRLSSDLSGNGWGWVIDNLKIQIEEQGPFLKHDHHDYIRASTAILPIVLKASDPTGVETISVEYFVNADAPQTFTFNTIDSEDINTLNLDLVHIQPGDVIHYKIRKEDNVSSILTLPASGYFNVPMVSFGNPVASYSNDFNTPTADFAGNFFSVTRPENFEDGAIHSDHFYANGFGLDNTSNYTYTLLKPICVSADNPYVKFDEIAIIETQDATVSFGTEAFNDYVIVEGSSDKGETWLSLGDGYDALSDLEWNVAFNDGEAGYPWYFRPHVVNLTESGDFHAGDVVLLRFRLHANATVNAWGWVIDNLNIQNAAAVPEEDLMEPMENQPESMMVQIYPNPVTETITVSWDDPTVRQAGITLINASGQPLYQTQLQRHGNGKRHEIDVRFLHEGLYLVKIDLNGTSTTRKVMKVN